MTDKWQDQTDDTLKRIESQDDHGESQIGFALDFRERVLISLSKLETSMEQNCKDHIEIKESCNKIPIMEIGLNNHLHTHDNMRKYIFYPIIVSAFVAILGILSKVVLHIF